MQENWQALFSSLNLFHKVAEQVGASLGYSYPEELHQRVNACLHRVEASNLRI